jgi:hypothetical protein
MNLQKLFLAAAIFTVTITSSQVRDYSDYNLVQNNDSLNRSRFLSDEEIAQVKGSPYVNGGVFLSGNIYKNNEKIMSNVLMRYNAYSDHFQTTKEGLKTPTGILLKDPGAVVEIGSKTYVFFPQGKVPGIGGYLELISEGKKASVYKRHNVTYVEAIKSNDSYTADKPARFNDLTTYYMVDVNVVFTELPQSKKKILKAFSGKQKVMKNYMKQNKLDVNNETDLAKIVAHYYSL